MHHAREWLSERLESATLWDGFDTAILGIASRCSQEPLVVYDRDRMLKILGRNSTEEDAMEFLQHNIECAWVGSSTPLILERVPTRARFIAQVSAVQSLETEVTRLRSALAQIAANNDEPYARDFARDIIERRQVP